jgi:hypothetical protein
MRFFMFLSPHSEKTSEKTQPVCLPVMAASASQKQVFPMCQSVVGLGLGFSGFFNLFCTPALASFVGVNAQDSAVSTSNFQAIPSLSASAQAISPKGNLTGNSAKSGSHYGGYSVAVEDSHRPRFAPPDFALPDSALPDSASPACELSFCTAHEVGLSAKKVGSDGALALELAALLSHPALSHVSHEDISVAQNELPDSSVTDSSGTDSSPAEIIPVRSSVAIAQIPDFLPDELSEDKVAQRPNLAEPQIDEELGSLRVQLQRSRESEELGILRLLQTAQAAPPPPPAPPVAFLSGRLGFFATDNVFRSELRLDDQIVQSGITAYYFPKLSESTNLYAIAETSLARYGNFGANYTQTEPRLGRNFPNVDYNQTELQLGLRQRLMPRTYAQIGWRNQRIYSPGYREKLFGINYLEAQLNHRSILNSKMWLDGFYQVRWGFASPTDADANDQTQPSDTSRVRQTFTLSLNYSATSDLRTSLLYQLDFDDYTQMDRFDTYQQVIGIVSYNLTPESQLSVFGGTRFGRSSSALINLDDTFYGAGLNVSVPLF